MRTTVSISDEMPDVPVFDGGTGLRPGVDPTSNRALHAVLDEGLDLNYLK